MRYAALCALASSVAFLTVGWAGAASQADRSASRAPFVPGAAFFSLGEPRFEWARTAVIDMGDGELFGCFPGRRFAQAIDVRNRSRHKVTLTFAAHRPIRPLGIVTLVATQLRREPLPHGMGLGGDITYMRHWSAAREQPVTIPAGRSAIIQSNFRMARCNDLAGGRTLVVPGEVVLRYRAAGTTGSETAVVPESRVVLTRGAAEHSCGPRITGGTSNVVAANLRCRVARRTAVACQRVGTCTSGRKLWDCAGGGCWLQRNVSRWFVVQSRRDP